MNDAAPPPANYDEALVGDYALPPLWRNPARALPESAAEAEATQAAWREIFAHGLYGEMPAAPDHLTWTRHRLLDANCERLEIDVEVAGRHMTVDAALWLPPQRQAPVGVIVGLDFLGPLGTLPSSAYPLDEKARVALPRWIGDGEGPLNEVMRGTSAHRFPIPLLLDAGYAVLTSCYGSWVPDDAQTYRQHGLWPLLGLDKTNAPPGVVCLWSWAIARLLDIAVALPEIDPQNIALAGHSRLGKAALWAAVNDQRVGTLFLNESGCGGAALSRRNFGESFAHNRHRFPHWLLSADQAAAVGLDALDQHQLLACLAPRRLYIASAAGDLWCDPRGEYLSLRAAAPFWSVFGEDDEFPDAEAIFAPGNGIAHRSLGWHLRAGGHELTPYDWTRFLDFLG